MSNNQLVNKAHDGFRVAISTTIQCCCNAEFV